VERLGAYTNVGETTHPRLSSLPEREILWVRVPVATTRRSRLLGLALLDRHQVGEGLLIPDCRRVHTFGMRFELDLFFLDGLGKVVELRRGVRPGRLARCPDADAVLGLPSPQVLSPPAA
jgi:uncharacterized membrane protein (UPF0127 family)